MACGRFDKEELPNPGSTIFKSDSPLYGLHISSDDDANEEEGNIHYVLLEKPLDTIKTARSLRRRKSRPK
jgi:hypothetical protein